MVNAIKAPIQMKTFWINDPGLRHELASEMSFSYVGDLVYITFGQTQVPVMSGGDDPPTQAEIRQVAKIVLSRATFHKFMKAFDGVREYVPAESED